MNSRRQKILLIMRITSDMVMVSLAWVIAYYLRFYTGLHVEKGMPAPAMYFKLIPFIAVIWLGVLSTAGFYRRTGRHRSPFIEAIDILQSCVLATFAFIAFTYFYEEYRYSRLTLVIFALLHPAMIITGRSLIRKALRYFRRHADPRSIVIIGSGEIFVQAIALSDLTDVTTRPVVSAILVGGLPEQVEASRQFCAARNITVLPVPTDWTEFFSQRQTQMVMLALPHGAYQFLENHLEEIVNQVADVRMIPDLIRYTKFAAGIEILRGVPVISVHESPLAGMGSVLKRLLDIMGAIVGVLLFAPVMLLACIVIKLTSPGPILYRQERMGIDGKTFEILKFRTMPVGSESKTGAVWAKPDDNRPTKFGSWLRRSSMDEIPQFFNVLLGDMSLVGPRPERPVFVRDFRTQIPGYMLRHKVKAGMTGWAQINGWRGDTSLEKRIECDLFYIQNWSIWLDLRILTLTFVRGFFNRNAY